MEILKIKLNNFEIVKEGKVLVYCQEEALCVTVIFINWHKFVFLKHQNQVAKAPCLLILDKSPNHLNEKVIEFLNDNKIKKIFIPGCLTSKLQPLDINVYKPFKDYFKQKYNQYQIENNCTIIVNNHHVKIDRNLIVELVYNDWYNEIST